MLAEHWDELNLLEVFQQVGAIPTLNRVLQAPITGGAARQRSIPTVVDRRGRGVRVETEPAGRGGAPVGHVPSSPPRRLEADRAV